MKTKVLLLGAVMTAFTLSAFAGDVLLSPRAQSNQIKVVASSANAPASAVTAGTPAAQFSPRAAANQIKRVSGTANEVNPYLECRKMMTGSPKAVGACAANPNMPACKKAATAATK